MLQVNLVGSQLIQTDCSNATMQKVNLFGANMTGSNMLGADLRDATLDIKK